jgi:hypothetical protein
MNPLSGALIEYSEQVYSEHNVMWGHLACIGNVRHVCNQKNTLREERTWETYRHRWEDIKLMFKEVYFESVD